MLAIIITIITQELKLQWYYPSLSANYAIFPPINQFGCMMEETKCIYGNGGLTYNYIYIYLGQCLM